MQEGVLRREKPRMDRCRAARRQGNHPQAETACTCDGNVSQAQHAEIRRHGYFQGRSAPFVAASGPDKYKNKKAVVIGSGNSGHDICAALWEAGADVTMVQRSSTLVARSDTLMELVLSSLYSEAALQAGITTDKADLISASLPYKVLPSLQVPLYAEM